jgi:hypothetical protein
MRAAANCLIAFLLLAATPAARSELLTECIGGRPRSRVGTGVYRVELAKAPDGALTAELLGGVSGGVLARWKVMKSRQGGTEAYSAKGFWLEISSRQGVYRSRSRHMPEPFRRFRGRRARLVEAQVRASRRHRTQRWRLRRFRMICGKPVRR